MVTRKTPKENPLLAAQADALMHLLPLYLNDTGYRHLRDAGFSRADAHKAITYLVERGKARLATEGAWVSVERSKDADSSQASEPSPTPEA